MAQRILFVVGKDPHRKPGGHSVYAAVHARAAARAGFEPHLFCLAEASGVEETDLGVIHRVRTHHRSLRQTRVPWIGPALARAVVDFAAPLGEPQLVHSIGPVWGWVGLEAAERLSRRGGHAVPVVSAYTTYSHEVRGRRDGVGPAHGLGDALRLRLESLWVEYVVDRYERRALRKSQRVLVNYESVRALVQERHGACEIRRLPYSTEGAFWPSRAAPQPPSELQALRPPDAPLIVCVARHDPRKGLDVLLEALAALRDRGVPFRACLVGGGELWERHRAQVQRLRLGGSALLTGWVDDPAPYLQSADVFALPSLEEGSGSLALLEALEAGRAVVASRVDGIPEDVQDGDSALLVEPGRVDAWSDALARVLGDVALRRRLSERGRERFQTRFAPELLVAALRDLYGELGFVP